MDLSGCLSANYTYLFIVLLYYILMLPKSLNNKKIKNVCGQIWLSCLSTYFNKKRCKIHLFLSGLKLYSFSQLQLLYFCYPLLRRLVL